MSSSLNPANSVRVTGSTAEQLISKGPAVVLAIIPESTTTGVVTLRDGGAADASGAVISNSAAGLTQQGKQFGPFGFRTGTGLTVQLAQAADAVQVVWMPQL